MLSTDLRIAYGNQKVWCWVGEWMDLLWMNGWMGGKAGLRIAYSDQKTTI